MVSAGPAAHDGGICFLTLASDQFVESEASGLDSVWSEPSAGVRSATWGGAQTPQSYAAGQPVNAITATYDGGSHLPTVVSDVNSVSVKQALNVYGGEAPPGASWAAWGGSQAPRVSDGRGSPSVGPPASVNSNLDVQPVGVGVRPAGARARPGRLVPQGGLGSEAQWECDLFLGELDAALRYGRAARVRNTVAQFAAETSLALAMLHQVVHCSGRGLEVAACLSGVALRLVVCRTLVERPEDLVPRVSSAQHQLLQSMLGQATGSLIQPVSISVDPMPPRLEMETFTQALPAQCAFLCSLGCLQAGMALERAVALWPPNLLGTPSCDGRLLSFAPSPAQLFCPVEVWRIPGPAQGLGLAVWVANGTLLAMFCPSQALPLPRKRKPPDRSVGSSKTARGCSAWAPKHVRLQRSDKGELVPPPFYADQLAKHTGAWVRELHIQDRVLLSILKGGTVFPKEEWARQIRPTGTLNPWEAVKHERDAIGPIIAQWLAAGVIEYVAPSDTQPLCILRCHGVPKSSAPWVRLVTDARPINGIFAKWPVRYDSIEAVRHLFARCSFGLTFDLKEAYHLFQLAGCNGAMVEGHVVRLAGGAGAPSGAYSASGGAQRIVHSRGLVGSCSPSSCLGTCDRNLCGMQVGSGLYRIVACQFGMALAGCPLSVLMRHLMHWVRGQGFKGGSWVDDLIAIRDSPAHTPCTGVKGGCVVCQHWWQACLKQGGVLKDMMSKLGLVLSNKDDVIGQVVLFLGVLFDTVSMKIRISEKKKVKLLAKLADFLSRGAPSIPLRELASIRGTALFYSCCIPYTRVAITELTRAIGAGPRADNEAFNWEASIPVSVGVQKAVQFLLDRVGGDSGSGQDMQRLPASSLYHEFLSDSSAGILVVTFDASPSGYAALIRFGTRDPLWIVSQFPWQRILRSARPLNPDNNPLGESDGYLRDQVHREALAGQLVFQQVVAWVAQGRFGSDWGSLRILVRNDCVAALRAFEFGSYHSDFLQSVAWPISESIAKLHLNVWFLHCPGAVIIDEGVDAASRSGVASILGPACAPSLRALIARVEVALSRRITVDLFASNCNALVPRFYSMYAQPGSCGVDALVQPSWSQYSCAVCSSVHSEFVFLFPPAGMEGLATRKARADATCGLALVPKDESTIAWQVLRAAMPPSWAAHYSEFRLESSYFNDIPASAANRKMCLIPFDFSVGRAVTSSCALAGPARSVPLVDDRDFELLQRRLSSAATA